MAARTTEQTRKNTELCLNRINIEKSNNSKNIYFGLVPGETGDLILCFYRPPELRRLGFSSRTVNITPVKLKSDFVAKLMNTANDDNAEENVGRSILCQDLSRATNTFADSLIGFKIFIFSVIEGQPIGYQWLLDNYTDQDIAHL